MLPGVRVLELKKIPDERGYFMEIMRSDWKEFLGEERIVQSNISSSFPGIVRAWHRHARGQVDYMVVLKGAMKICAYDDRPGSSSKGQLDEIISSAEKLQVVRIPGLYWHGSKTVSSEPSMLLYFVSNLYDYANPDEERRPWNDETVIDPRSKSPYDWNKSANR